MVTADPLTLSLCFAAMGSSIETLYIVSSVSEPKVWKICTFSKLTFSATPARNRSHT